MKRKALDKNKLREAGYADLRLNKSQRRCHRSPRKPSPSLASTSEAQEESDMEKLVRLPGRETRAKRTQNHDTESGDGDW